MLNPSRFECPRCGFGIRPGDGQCGRCGEDLRSTVRPVQTSFSTVKFDKGKVEESSTVRIRTVGQISVARPDSALQFREDDLQRRERALLEKERRLAALADMLDEREQEIKAMPMAEPIKPPDPIEMDEVRQKVREDMLRQFEPEMEALQSQLDEKEEELRQVRLKAESPGEADVRSPVVDQDELDRLTVEIFEELQGQLQRAPSITDAGVLRTNINKLDEMLGGGIPQGHTVLFNGSPGTMKSTLVYTILHRAAVNDGYNGLYLSLEQSKRSVLRQMGRMGMPLEATGGRLMVADLQDLREGMVDVHGNWREVILQYVMKIQSETGFKVFALDSLESFKAITEHQFERQELKDLFDWFKSLGITVLVISENISDDYDEANQGEAYLSDGIMEMLMKEMNDSRVQRWIRCVKMRGTKTDSRYYSIFHGENGFNLSLPLANQPF